MTSWTLRRLARMIIMILRIFRVSEFIGASESVRKPSKRLSLLELSEPCVKAQIDDRVWQRLVYGRSSRAEPRVPVSSILPAHVQQLLSSPTWTRTDADIEEACQSMRKCPSFCNYQAHTQLILCRIGWYQRLEPGRVILKAGHPAGGLYFVLSGTVVVLQKRMMNLSTEVTETVEEGSTFGEVSVVADAKQTATCVTASNVEIFAIGRCDYIDLSLCQGRACYQSSKHVSFCKTIGLLQFLPLHLLDQQSGMISIAYYRKGSVIVRDSRRNDWIYIVMSGMCQVVKMFLSTGTWQHDDFPNSDPSTNHFHCNRARGLSRMVYADEPSVILVSRGSQCISISKEFVQVHMHAAVQAKLRKEILQYPSEDTMLKRVKEHHNWSIYKDMFMKKIRLD